MQEKQNNVLIRGIFECLAIPEAVANETIDDNVVYCYSEGTLIHHEHEAVIIKETMELGYRPFLLLEQAGDLFVLYVDGLVENADAIKETQSAAHERVSAWLKEAREDAYHVLVYRKAHPEHLVEKVVEIRRQGEGHFQIV